MRRYGTFVFLLLVLATVPSSRQRGRAQQEQSEAPANESKAEIRAATRLPRLPEEFIPEIFLERTERFLGPPSAQVLLSLGHELQSRGFDDVARQVYQSLETKEKDRAELVGKLISLGLYSAADAVLRQWLNLAPGSIEARKLKTVLHLGEGSPELAYRELSNLIAGNDRALMRAEQFFAMGQLDQAFAELRILSESVDDPLAGLLIRLIVLQRRGLGSELNPWGVDFVGEAGTFEAGQISESEAVKFEPGSLEAMIELVELLPRQSNLWVLLGDLFNAAGETDAALVCFRRAESLQSGSPELWEKIRKLDEYSVPSPAPAPSAPPDSSDRDLINGVVLVGGILVLFLVVLQIRQWLRPRRR